MQDEEDPRPPIVVPKGALSDEALNGVINEFILREGTDYGHSMPGIDEKMARVHKQIDAKHVFIVFDPSTETCTLLNKNEMEQKGVQYGI